MGNPWKRWELRLLVLYALAFYAILIHRSLQLSHDYFGSLRGLRSGWISDWMNDLSDAQWRNFRENFPVLTVVFAIFIFLANFLRSWYELDCRGMSVVWLLISLVYLIYLHGACAIFVLLIATANFKLAKIFANTQYFSFVLWLFNIVVLICNRIYEGYSFSLIGG